MSDLYRVSAFVSATLGLLICLNFQATALSVDGNRNHSRSIAALSLELGFTDNQYTSTIYPSDEVLLPIALRASARNISIFGVATHKDVSELMGERLGSSARFDCAGNLDLVTEISESNEFDRIVGWQYDPIARKPSQRIIVADMQGKIVGYALSGMNRKDVANAVGARALNSGFVGYLKSTTRGKPVRLIGADIGCVTQVSIPVQ